MAKDWKQVAKEQKLVIAELKGHIREHEAWDKRQQRMYARLEKASLFYFREMERLDQLVKRLKAKKATSPARRLKRRSHRSTAWYDGLR